MLIPLGLQAVTEELRRAVVELAGPRYQRKESDQPLRRWGSQRGSVYLADQKLPVEVPRVRNVASATEVPLRASWPNSRSAPWKDMTWWRCSSTARASPTRRSSSRWASPSTDRRSLWASCRRPPRNERVCRRFLSDLVERGLQFEAGLLVVMDGAKGLYKAVMSVLKGHACVQRCKRGNRDKLVEGFVELTYT